MARRLRQRRRALRWNAYSHATPMHVLRRSEAGSLMAWSASFKIEDCRGERTASALAPDFA
jgi:hypothetical protein